MEDFDTSNNKLILLNNPKHITLKRCLIDELGFSNLRVNGYEPTYNYFFKDDKIIIWVEGPGNCRIKSSIEYSGEYTIIKLIGEKKYDVEPKNIEDNIHNTREYGKLTLHLPLKTEDFLIKNENPTINEKKGLLILEYKIDSKSKETEYNPEYLV